VMNMGHSMGATNWIYTIRGLWTVPPERSQRHIGQPSLRNDMSVEKGEGRALAITIKRSYHKAKIKGTESGQTLESEPSEFAYPGGEVEPRCAFPRGRALK
jgi:hypothetical protein